MSGTRANARASRSPQSVGITARLRDAAPSWRLAAVGAAIWGLAMGASAVAALLFDQWETTERIRTVAVLFAMGGALAFPVAWTLATLLTRGRRQETAFAASFVSLAAATIGLTALLYALQYRSYYAEWHAPAFTVTWAFQFVFTGLVAAYQFAVLGVRMYFPLGFVALIAAALWFARRSR